MPKSFCSWNYAFLMPLRAAFLAALAIPFLFVLAAGNLYAQVEKATLSGTVTDPSGAVIVDAKVQAKNVNTSVTYSGATDTQGRYTLAEMQVGTYEVTAEKAGFQQHGANRRRAERRCAADPGLQNVGGPNRASRPGRGRGFQS